MNQSYTVLEQEFSIYLRTLGFSKSVVSGYPKMAYLFLDYLHTRGITKITQLTAAHLNSYKHHLETRPNLRSCDRGLSTAHLNKHFHVLDKFMEFLHAHGLHNLPSPPRFRAMDLENTIPAVSEVEQLYNSCGELFPGMPFHQAAPRRALAVLILDLCYGCGLRKSEAFNLTLDDVDLDRKLLFIRQAKGYKDRYVPLSDTVRQRLTDFIYNYRRDFECPHNRIFPLACLESMTHYVRLLRRASGVYFGLHTLRHSIATHLLQNGMGVEQTAQLLGHSSLESTQIYTHILESASNEN
jgi:integrase/recombinase XerD